MTQMDSKARIVLRGENSIYCRNLILLFTKRNVKKLMRDGMGGRREEGSGWGTHVYLWRIHLDIWQN